MEQQQERDLNSARKRTIAAALQITRTFEARVSALANYANAGATLARCVEAYTVSASKMVGLLSVLPCDERTCTDGVVRHLLGLTEAVRTSNMLDEGLGGRVQSALRQTRVVTKTLRTVVMRLAWLRYHPLPVAKFVALDLVRYARHQLFRGCWACPPVEAEMRGLARAYTF